MMVVLAVVNKETCVCLCGTPNHSNNLKAFAIIQHLSTAMFALQQCLDFFAQCDLSALSTQHEDYGQSSCAYRALQPCVFVCVCVCEPQHLNPIIAFAIKHHIYARSAMHAPLPAQGPPWASLPLCMAVE